MSTTRLPLLLASLYCMCACQPFRPNPPHPFNQPNTSSAVATQGVVTGVERPRPEDSQAFVHLVITPQDRQPIRLVLAPGWYLDRQGIRFEPRDNVTVIGKADGSSDIVVQSIQKGDKTIVLRDSGDHPVWSQ